MRLLCYFSLHIRYNAFRIEELEALAISEGVELDYLWQVDTPRPSSTSTKVFVFCHLPNEDIASRIQKKSILIKGFIEVWSTGEDYNYILSELINNRSQYFDKHLKDKSWAFKFISFNRSVQQNEIKEIMLFFDPLLNGAGEVNLTSPETLLCIAEDWQHRGQNKPELLKKYFGRIVSQRVQKNPFWQKYKLSKRIILGPTTLDNELSFLMCNQAGINPNMIVLDPFVGTGSILIAATHLGATCIGSDIDVRVLKGWGISYKNFGVEHKENEKTDIFQNFLNYKLPLPDIIRADTAHSVWRSSKLEETTNKDNIFKHRKPWIDAIITDPPYGIRAGARTTGPSNNYLNTVTRESNYIFPTSWYNSRDTIKDLLDLSSELLVENGKLVFLLLVETENATAQLSTLIHKDFDLLSASPQTLPAKRSRFLITMNRKVNR